MKPLFSVVIPLYNKEKSILRAIDSVLNQTEQDFELIIVNDGSIDHSAELVDGVSDNAKIRIIHQENAGVSAARNRGVTEAQAELIGFLDADDEWLPEFLSTILKLKNIFPEAKVFGTLYSFQSRMGELSLPKTASLFKKGSDELLDNYLEIVRIGLPFNSSTFGVYKSALDEIGGFPLGIQFGEDVDAWIRLSFKNRMAYSNKPLAIYHQDAENRACDAYYPAMKEYYPVTNLIGMIRNKDVPYHLVQSAIEYAAKYQIAFANLYLHNENPIKARELLCSCSGTKIYIRDWLFFYTCTFVPPSVLKILIKIKNIVGGGLV
jgi:glycosyltransferase involved in cell wall biosynthesis